MKKLTLFWGGLLVLFTTTLFISCSEDDIDADVEVTSVTLSSSTLTLKVGSTSLAQFSIPSTYSSSSSSMGGPGGGGRW